MHNAFVLLYLESEVVSLEHCNYGFRVVFRLAGGKYSRSLKTHDEKVAYAALGRLEENLDLVERGKIEIPENADVCTFLLTDGKRTSRSVASPKAVSLSQLFKQYLDHLPEGAMEKNSLYTARIHMKHIENVLGSRFPVRDIDKLILQGYVNQRALQKGKRRKPISPTAIRKELATLSSV